MQIPLLYEIFVILGLSVAVIFVFHRLKIPAIVGFILTGILAGPSSLGLVKAVHEVEQLAEIGIVLLLFTIGLEFSFKSLRGIKRSFLLGGSFQLISACLLGFAIARACGLTSKPALFMGFLLSLSSTAIVLKMLQDKAQVDSPQGRTSLAILIFQDVSVVPMMLLTPLLAFGTGADLSRGLLILLGKALAIIVLVLVSARWIVPRLLFQIARTKNRELFLLVVAAVCLGVAWLTNYAGLSLALGAFLAGLIISESEYSQQALGNMIPFRDLFTSFFFVSIGMLLNLEFIFQHPATIVLLVLLVILGKALVAGMAAAILGFPIRIVILVGLYLSQVGEFSFVLSRSGVAYGLLQGDTYQLFLAVSVLTMALTPLAALLAEKSADAVSKLPLSGILRFGSRPLEEAEKEAKKDHLVIIGFGFNGRNLARAASLAGIAYEIVEMNPDTVREEKARGLPISYGDATQEPVLEQADIKAARIAVIAISDPSATRRVTELSRKLNPRLYIIVRTRYLAEMKPLYELGADEVIPEEMETSVEIFTRLLNKYLVPKSEIEKFVSEVRAGGYQMLRSLSRERTEFSDLRMNLPDLEITVFRLPANCSAAGKTVGELALRKKHGVTVVAVRRGEQVITNPGAETGLFPGDTLIVIGTLENISKAACLFE